MAACKHPRGPALVGGAAMPAKKDLTGQRFGHLKVMMELPEPTPKIGRSYWLCKCDCGNYIELYIYKLTIDHKTDCGCIERAKAEKIAQKKKEMQEKACPFPCASCERNKQSTCCRECGARRICENACKNTPDKCGRGKPNRRAKK